MAVLTKVFVSVLLAMSQGTAMAAAIQAPEIQAVPEKSSIQVPTSVHHVHSVTYSVVDISGPASSGASLSTVHLGSSDQIQVAQGVTLTTTASSESHSRPLIYARDDKNQSSQSSQVTPHGYGPIQTATPVDISSFVKLGRSGVDQDSDDIKVFRRDDYDGYGYGSGPGSTPTIDGGYGSPSEPTALPPGGYGDPAPPAVEKPTIVTVPDPVTVIVTLSIPTTSSAFEITSTVIPSVVTVTVTSTPVPQAVVHNATQTVMVSKSTTLHPSIVTVYTTSTNAQQSVTPTEKSVTTPSTEGYVYTTVTSGSSVSHTSSNTVVIMQTPTGHAPPKPITDTNDGDSNLKMNLHLLVMAAIFATMGPSMSHLVSGTALLMHSNYLEDLRNAKAAKEAENSTGSSSDGKEKKPEVDESPNGHEGPESAIHECCCHQAPKNVTPIESKATDKKEKPFSLISSLIYSQKLPTSQWKLGWSENRHVVKVNQKLDQFPLGLRFKQAPQAQISPQGISHDGKY